MLKKNRLKITMLTLFVCFLASCASTGKPEKIKNDPSVDKVIFESEDSEGFKLTTSITEWPSLQFGSVDLEGYKYLNIELYSPNCVDGYISIDSWGEEKMVAQFIGPVPAEPILFQALINDNTLSFICIASGLFDGDIRVEGVDCYIKKVWATNTKAEFNGNDYAN